MKFLKVCFCLVLLVSVQVMAAPGLHRIQADVRKASAIWQTDQNKAQEILNDAFANAISWTRPQYLDSIREKGFFVAVSCYSPELVSETMLAADTYLKLFPQGRHTRQVNIYKAMAAFAIDDVTQAVQAIDAARNASKKRKNYKSQTMLFNGYVSANHHRKAEKFIEGERLTSPSAKLKKDLRRFHKGNRRVERVLQQVREGSISGQAAAELIDKEIETAYFAKKAPQAALTSVALKDNDRLAFNPVSLEWCGFERSVKHSLAPQIREKKYKEFLQNFPEAPADETYQALQNLRNIYLYEMRDKIKARQMLAHMKALPGFARRAEIEKNFCEFTPDSLISESGNAFLSDLYHNRKMLPYDNGALPVLDFEKVELMLAISNMVLGKGALLKLKEQKGYADLPVALLYYAAIDKKDRAWVIYSHIKPGMALQIDKMLEDCIFPLYLPMPVGERYFFAGLAALRNFPDLGTDLLIKSLSDETRMYRSEHALAILAETYNKHLAHREAQKVWQILGKLHPDSVWLK
jgi:hypothetical protein